ncbi:hypothetical protein Fuma_00168 [Fuerstiella marisgermanici]|uniref:Uncharacterized protein n=1 Tax=Fuerstiella marisgermanici TaxID=1891926 RepID=A0A1P8W959_9PLAN|nr:hypothetical protein Fuma_00168 [Fuerstiella marisgermanici]
MGNRRLFFALCLRTEVNRRAAGFNHEIYEPHERDSRTGIASQLLFRLSHEQRPSCIELSLLCFYAVAFLFVCFVTFVVAVTAVVAATSTSIPHFEYVCGFVEVLKMPSIITARFEGCSRSCTLEGAGLWTFFVKYSLFLLSCFQRCQVSGRL